MDDLNAHFPAEVTLEAAGERFTLTAFKAKNLRPYLAIHRRLQDKAVRLGQDLAEAHAKLRDYRLKQAAGVSLPMPDLGDVPMFVVDTEALDADQLPIDLLHERCYEEYVDLVMAATGKPLQWVEDLGIDELVTLAGIVNELNARRYAPKKPSALEATATPQS